MHADDAPYDLFEPHRRGTGLAVAFVHGGGWYGGDRSQFHPLARWCARHGQLAASLGYRTSMVPLAGKLLDLRHGLAALAGLPGVDRVAVVGSSAGAHLGTLLALRPPGGVAVSGLMSINGPGAIGPADVINPNWPTRRVQLELRPADLDVFTSPPPQPDLRAVSFVLAERETWFPHDRVRAFAGRLREPGRVVTVDEVAGTSHGFAYGVLDTSRADAFTELLRRFLAAA